MQAHSRMRLHCQSPRSAQRGVTLVIAIIALAILTIGAAALVRSTNSSLLQAGNLAFKRDLANQAERAVALALADLNTGSLASETARESVRQASNYSPVTLATNAQGVPNALISDSAFTALGFTRADVVDSGSSVTIRYVIDRMCAAGTGAFSADRCLSVSSSSDQGGSGFAAGKRPPGTARPVYRISVRVTGPRGAQTFVQTTVAR